MSEVEGAFLLDANVLVALVSREHVHHGSAHRWFDVGRRWATTPVTEAAFVRLIVNPVVVGQRVSVSDALEVLRRLCGSGDHRFVADASALLNPRIDLTGLVGHRQVTDFHLVNLAAGSGHRLATFDGGLAVALAPADRRHVELIPV